MNTPTMNYQLLGRSGLRISDLCLGTMTFGQDWGWGSSKDEARQIYDAYRAAGGNFVDTANVYTNGTSEALVGEFVAGHRPEVDIATKYTSTRGEPGASAGGNHRKSMVEAVERTVREVVAVAGEMGVSPAQVAIAWLLHRPVPVIPILGARKLSQFEDNLRCLTVTFTPEQLARLDKASAVPLGFPHEFLAGDPMQGFVFGQAKGRVRV